MTSSTRASRQLVIARVIGNHSRFLLIGDACPTQPQLSSLAVLLHYGTCARRCGARAGWRSGRAEEGVTGGSSSVVMELFGSCSQHLGRVPACFLVCGGAARALLASVLGSMCTLVRTHARSCQAPAKCFPFYVNQQYRCDRLHCVCYTCIYFYLAFLCSDCRSRAESVRAFMCGCRVFVEHHVQLGN